MNVQTRNRLFAFVILLAIGLLLRPLLNTVLLTFIFCYIFNNLITVICKYLNISKRMFENALIVLIYLLFGCLFLFLIIKYMPIAFEEILEIISQVASFKVENIQLGFINSKDIHWLLSQININDYLKGLGSSILLGAKDVGSFIASFFISYMLSLFFLLGKDNLALFSKKLEQSHASTIYKEFKYFGNSFDNSFGKVFQTQILIAFINSILSIIILTIFGFPNVLGLGFMIFFLGLIPVAGVLISLVPLSIIAFSLGGIIKVVVILIMITILHTLESYILSPKLMSAKTHLPVFLVFAILIISEYYLGIWGLLIGLPLFIFFFDIIGIYD